MVASASAGPPTRWTSCSRAPRRSGGRATFCPDRLPRTSSGASSAGQTANTAGSAAEDVGGLDPGERPTEDSQNDLLDFHGALHGADGIGHGHLLGDQFSSGARLERSFHVALGSGQITYSRHEGREGLCSSRHRYTLSESQGRQA
jgi:hypothetical protein